MGKIFSNNPWGFHLMIDLYECNFKKISDESYIKQFVIDLCEHIEMTRHGDLLIDRFGVDEGYSFCQLIEESNIAAHFIESRSGACIDIFSCKAFDRDKATEFCVNYFEAYGYNSEVFNRG